MFGKKDNTEWKPDIKYDGDNIVEIYWKDAKTLDYLIGLGYVVLTGCSDAYSNRDSIIYLKKPTTKNMEGNA